MCCLESRASNTLIFFVRDACVCIVKRKFYHSCTPGVCKPLRATSIYNLVSKPKVFNKMRHEEAISMLETLSIGGNDKRIIMNMYWLQETAMRIESQLGLFNALNRVYERAVCYRPACSDCTVN